MPSMKIFSEVEESLKLIREGVMKLRELEGKVGEDEFDQKVFKSIIAEIFDDVQALETYVTGT